MNFKILLLALVAFSFLLAGCAKKGVEQPPLEEVTIEESGEAEDEGLPQEGPSSAQKQELANFFDIEIDEPPEDFVSDEKAPGEE